MPKASPRLSSFNAGIFSVLMQGRVDLDKYPASVQQMLNAVATPQGPFVGRSGSIFVNSAITDTSTSALVPFVYNQDQIFICEVGGNVIRFWDEDGPHAFASSPVTAYTPGTTVTIVSAVSDVSPGDHVFLEGFPGNTQVNGVIAAVLSASGPTYTLQLSSGATVADLTGCTVAKVYEISHTYSAGQCAAMRGIGFLDTVYLFSAGAPWRKLVRFAEFDWRLTDVTPIDGPFLNPNDGGVRVTPATTGNASTNATGTATGNASSGNDATNAFDDDKTTYWESDTNQTGRIEFEPTTPFACNGFILYAARANDDPDYAAKDYAPGEFTFQGFDGTDWRVLDAEADYVLYDGFRSGFFRLNNAATFSKYALDVTQCTRNGPIPPRLDRLVMSSATAADIDIVLSDVTGTNNDTGLQSTDVGRLIRLHGRDGYWRAAVITAVADTLNATIELQDDPFVATDTILEWRLGYWSMTTGWPIDGVFLQGRLWLVGCASYPDLVVASVSLEGQQERFSETDQTGTVSDDSAIVERLRSKELATIRWVSTDQNGVLLGTSAGEFVVGTQDATKGFMTPTNVKSRPVSDRAANNTPAEEVDKQVLYIDEGGDGVREFAYVFSDDTYNTPNMSQYSTELSGVAFAGISFQRKPYQIAWVWRVDGSLVAMTYDRDEQVIGWHTHDLAGGFVERVCCARAKTGRQTNVWLVVVRSINGVSRRYIERLAPFQDFTTDENHIWRVDCGLSYGPANPAAPIDTLYLPHLAGMDVVGLADFIPFGPINATGGVVKLPNGPANDIVVGLPFDTELQSMRIEAGAADGTAQGKQKRINFVTIFVWNSYGGEVGVMDRDTKEVNWTPIDYPNDDYRLSEATSPVFFTGLIELAGLGPSSEIDGCVFVRQTPNRPWPLNVIAIYPQLNVQDR